MKLKKLILFCFLFSMLIVKSQDTVRVGNPNEAPIRKSEMMPFNGKYDYSWSSIIYTSAEMGSNYGEIARLGFYVDNNANAIMHNQKIYARLTDETSYGTGNNLNHPGTAGFTELYSGDITYSGSGWKYVDLTTKIEYVEGKSIEFLFENRDANSNDNCLSTGTAAQCSPKFRQLDNPELVIRGKRDYVDKGWPIDCKMCGGGIRRPIIEIIIPCKVKGGIPVANPEVICNGQSTQITLTQYSPTGNGSIIEWFQVVNGTPVPLSQYYDQETFTFNPVNNLNVPLTISLMAVVTKATNQSPYSEICQKSSTTLSITVNPNPTANAGADIAWVIGNPPVTIGGSPAASGTLPVYTFQWSPSIGLNQTNIANPAASPAQTITYTLTVTDPRGCQNSDEMILTVLQPGSFYEPKMSFDGMMYYAVEKLRVKYTEDYKDADGMLSYKIYELANRNEVLNAAANPLPVIIGDNRYIIDMAVLPGFTVGKKYLMEIINDKKEKFYLRFVYKS